MWGAEGRRSQCCPLSLFILLLRGHNVLVWKCPFHGAICQDLGQGTQCCGHSGFAVSRGGAFAPSTTLLPTVRWARQDEGAGMPTLFWTLHQAGEKVSFPISATCCCFLVGEKTTDCTRVCQHTPQPSSFHGTAAALCRSPQPSKRVQLQLHD